MLAPLPPVPAGLANRTRRLAICLSIAGAACVLALALGASTAFAVTLTSTTAPLAGSNFQGGDGNEDNPGADKSTPPDGVTDIDWQSRTNASAAIDDNTFDTAFNGG